jgi:tetratricopeptide (TPR) repeat protein
VFTGGCTVEAVEAICSVDGEHEMDVLAGLDSLIDHSLLFLSAASDERFIMLETIREYALERLNEAAEAETVRARHASYYLAIAEAAEPHLWGARQDHWLARLEEEHGNLREALRVVLEHGQAKMGLRLAAALWRFWHIRGHLSEGRRWLESMLAQSITADPALHARALNGAGVLAQSQGDYDRAIRLHEESLALRRALGDRRGIASSLNNLGLIASAREEYARATALMEESLAIGREMEDRDHVALLLNNLGDLQMRQSNYDHAESCFAESESLLRERGNKRGLALVLCNRGTVATLRGEHGRAIELSRGSLLLCRELGHRVGMADSLEKLAWALAESRPSEAVRLWGAVETLREPMGEPLEPSERSTHDRRLAMARTVLSDDDFARYWQEGRAMTLDDALDYALAQTDIA